MGKPYKCSGCGEMVSTVGQCCTDGSGNPKQPIFSNVVTHVSVKMCDKHIPITLNEDCPFCEIEALKAEVKHRYETTTITTELLKHLIDDDTIEKGILPTAKAVYALKKAEVERDRLRGVAEGVREQLAGGIMNDTIADILYTIIDEALNHKEG